MAYIGKAPGGTGVRQRYLYTATSGQTTFTTSDSGLALSYSDTNYMDVYQNGVLLDPANDYTATSGTSVVLGTGATTGDVIEIIVYDVFSVFNNTVTGNFTVGNNLTVSGTSTLSTVDINAGNIDGTTIGAATPAAGTFTTGDFNTSLNVDGTVTSDGLTVAGAVDISYGDYQNSGAIKIGADLGQNTSRTDASRKFGAITAAHFDNDEADLGLITMDSSSTSVSALTIGGGSSSFNSASTINFQTSSDGASAGTTAMVIDASQRVGIGTTSPYGALTVDTANGILNIANGNTSGGTKIQAWGATPSNGYLAIEGYTKEYMRITSDGSVGIGTSLPASALDVNGQIISNDSFKLTANVSTPAGNAMFRPASNTLAFATNSAERMRIDSSGNVDFGYTSGTAGGVLGARGSGTSFITLKTTTGAGAGLTGSDNRILPMDESALADNNTDLGMSSYRFKDLYLGGSVYLGGTGSANALDDYEEGTFSLTTVTSGYTGSGSGNYTKIGNTVNVWVKVEFSAVSSSSNSSVQLSGLPFNSSNNAPDHYVGVVREATTSGDIFVSQINKNDNKIAFNSMDGVSHNSNQPILANKVYLIQATYRTA